MNILIVEDEKLAVRKLSKLLEEIAPEHTVIGVTPSIEETVTWIQTNRDNGHSEPELIFMDIELADGQSFEIFNRITVKSTIIFTTSYDEYALQAFKVNSIDYLLKPVQKDELQRSLKKFEDLRNPVERSHEKENLANILKKLSLTAPLKEYRKRFLVRQGQKLISVEVNEIAYFYIDERVSLFHTFQGQKYIVDYTLDELVDLLEPESFFRINRGMIVTHRAVAQIQPYFNNRYALILRPDLNKEVIVSREKTQDFKIWMGK
jgi:two-component system response regulator LytT